MITNLEMMKKQREILKKYDKHTDFIEDWTQCKRARKSNIEILKEADYCGWLLGFKGLPQGRVKYITAERKGVEIEVEVVGKLNENDITVFIINDRIFTADEMKNQGYKTKRNEAGKVIFKEVV